MKAALTWYFKQNLLLKILCGLVLGAIFGLIFGESALWVAPLGDIFVRLLKMIVMPVIFFTLIVGAASIDPARLGRVGLKIMAFYMVTSGLAVSVGLLVANMFSYSAGVSLDTENAAGKTMASTSFIDTLVNIIPKNPFSALAKGEILPTIFFALILGIGISYLQASSEKRLKQAGDTLFAVCDGFAEVMYMVVRAILHYAPFGVFALIAVVFAKQGAKAFGPLSKVTFSVYLAYAIHFVVVYGLALKLYGFGFAKFMSKIKESLLTAFVTRSSSGTLPVTMKCAEEKMGISKSVFSFTLPVGATINMDGTAIYQGVCVMFIASSVGVTLDMAQQLSIVLTVMLSSIGTAGIPGAGAILLLIVLNSVGLSVDSGSQVAAAYAIILGIDALLDMGRTAVNVAGDLSGTAIVAKTEKQVDLSQW